MKKLLLLAISFMISLAGTTLAQTKEYKKEQVQFEKTAKNLAKKKAKEFKKDKWETSGATDLETILINYYLETEPSCGGEKQGVEHTVTDAKTISMAEKRLLLDAQAMYAQEIRTMLAQTLTSQDSATGEDELSTYISNVVAKSQNEFNGDLNRAFIIYRPNPDGKTLTVRGYYILDKKNGLARARSLAKKVEQNSKTQKMIEKAAQGE